MCLDKRWSLFGAFFERETLISHKLMLIQIAKTIAEFEGALWWYSLIIVFLCRVRNLAFNRNEQILKKVFILNAYGLYAMKHEEIQESNLFVLQFSDYCRRDQ